MDISNITSTSTELDLLHPGTRERIGWKLIVRPTDSAEVQAANRKYRNLIVQQKRKLNANTIEEAQLERLAAHVENWFFDDGVTFEGGQLACTPQNARRVLKEKLWIRSQLEEVVDDEAEFF